MDTNTIVCSKLALERCKNYINQIHAVVFLCRDDDRNLNGIAGLLDMELQASYDLLEVPESEE